MIKKVMLIDDDRDEHEIFSEQLGEYDKRIELICAHNGDEAFDILEKNAPDCIFLDINMPGMNGLQVLEKLKDDENLKNIPVCIYSTSDGYKSRKPAIKLGAVHYFRKPNTGKELKEIFKMVFEK